MSRLRRLKERKRKNSIKATACSLALTLGIGIVQSTTTYALFTDKVPISNHLSITMGKLDVKIEEGLDVDNLQVDQISKKKFSIENTGSLDQKIKLKFSKLLESEYLEYIDYNLDIKTSKGEEVWIDRSSGELFNKDKKTRLILEPKDYLNCTSTINIDKEITPKQQNLLSEKTINFNITVLASQVNYINGVIDNKEIGFTDKCIQNNLVKIGEIVEPPKEEGEAPSEPEVIQPQNEEEKVPSKPEVIQPQNEEEKVPSKPGVIQPQNEEEKVPSKPEVVEPQNEEEKVPSKPEVIQPQNEEEKVPSKPGVIQPQNEEEKVPSKPEVVEPQKVEEIVVP